MSIHNQFGQPGGGDAGRAAPGPWRLPRLACAEGTAPLVAASEDDELDDDEDLPIPDTEPVLPEEDDWDDEDFDDEFDDDFEDELDQELERELAERFGSDDGSSPPDEEMDEDFIDDETAAEGSASEDE